MRYHKVPDETIRRLPVYLRGLCSFTNNTYQNISSQQLADILHVKSPQLRKDLSYFGDIGTPGVGYDIQKLKEHIRAILRLNNSHNAALIGYGNLGAALLKYAGFKIFGIDINAVFEKDPRKTGRVVQKIKIEDVSKLSNLRERNIAVAIIAIPALESQEITDQLVEAGVGGILNFTPSYLSVPHHVKVINIDIGVSLACLPYYLPVGA
ncbi:MAG: redox-sensing transcriptional repressor Rex [Deltaproteobacteria bacterium]|nr:redox-sensing transcriptional repressor Rex [Deltaproteobacteria bacterium]